MLNINPSFLGEASPLMFDTTVRSDLHKQYVGSSPASWR